jgi:hypothetical protein
VLAFATARAGVIELGVALVGSPPCFVVGFSEAASSESLAGSRWTKASRTSTSLYAGALAEAPLARSAAWSREADSAHLRDLAPSSQELRRRSAIRAK